MDRTRAFVRRVAYLTVFGTCGCTAGTGQETAGNDGDSPFSFTLSASQEISTVIQVDWDSTLTDMVSARVEFGPDTDFGHVATVDLGSPGPYRTFLLGSKPESEVHVRVVAETPEGTRESSDQTILTGPVPAEFANLDVTLPESRTWEGYLVTGLAAAPASVILDQDGDYVWWHRSADKPDGWPGGTVVLGRSALARDGSGLRYLMANGTGLEDVAIRTVSADGYEMKPISTPYAHHDFVELDDGTIAYLAFDPREIDGRHVSGDRVMEVSSDGTSREVYNIWDHYSFPPTMSVLPEGEWPHANAIDYDPQDDAYLVSFLELSAIVEISRPTGETLRTIGGEQSDYALAGGSRALFSTQHQFEWFQDDIVVFVNGELVPGAVSSVAEYALDDATGIALPVWSYHPSPSVTCSNFGDVDRLDSGNTLVTFSVAGLMQEVEPSGTVVWQLQAGIGGALGYATRVDDLDLSAFTSKPASAPTSH
jgi:hypothetical protein